MKKLLAAKKFVCVQHLWRSDGFGTEEKTLVVLRGGGGGGSAGKRREGSMAFGA